MRERHGPSGRAACRVGWRLVGPGGRHPSAMVLGAWFDGEGHGEVASHVAVCERCRRRLHELRRVRGALRGEPVAPHPVGSRVGWRPILVPVVAVVALLLASGAPSSLPGPPGMARRYLPGSLGGDGNGDREPSLAAPGGSVSSTSLPPVGHGRSDSVPPSVVTVPGGSHSGGSVRDTPGVPQAKRGVQEPAGSTHPGPSVVPLRLGAVVAGDPAAADETAEIETALRRAVMLANDAGGAAGRPVELVVARNDDAAAVTELARSVDVIVGGSGIPAPPGALWVFPTDPTISGTAVVAAEWSPRDVAARLAEDLDTRHVPGPVGVIVGDGPEASFADGLAATRRTVIRLPAGTGGGCDDEVLALRRRGVAALGVAGGPDLVQACLDAAARFAWRPPGGVMVPPSAAYAHLERLPSAQGVRTVLTFPWPTADSPGAARYRAAVPGGHSYRGLVSFAAAELAVQVARSRGTIDLAGILAGHWRSDLFDLDGTHHHAPAVVAATLGAWTPAPSSSPPEMGSHPDPTATPGR